MSGFVSGTGLVWKVALVLALGVSLFNLSDATSAQETPPPVQPDTSETVHFTSAPPLDPIAVFAKALGIIAGLGLVLYLVLRFYKNSLYGRGGSTSAAVKVLGTTFLAPKKSVYLVQVLDHFLVLGLTENQVTVLLDVPMQELSDHLKETLLQGKAISEPAFKKLLNNWMRK
ncbi:MAG: flagellar biosynthetic protein FliO [bacterium]